ncbi:DUF983 domain-containing protein [Rhodobacteraceae bacterium RKSG542]|uniref:DUF983 domain-containing protein n=1 Tax=Pseudovibrio flavus TaxID=2529854 RepID=UPI0012BCB664|nr:DUF983 domain-containing protein [Pseudovibrio flavus]MTI18651.1 DUF983 domain-containing protein [Pseudovibrio flavus]
MEKNNEMSLARIVGIGLRGKCPFCGQSSIFKGYLTLRSHCPSCGSSLESADPGDGPAVFIIMFLGFVIVGGVLLVEMAYQPPMWLHLVIWLPLTIILSLVVLRPLKGLIIALQFFNKASEGKRDE